MGFDAVYSGAASTLENQHKSCSTPADYIKDGKFKLILKTVVYGTVTHVPFLFNRTTALRGCGLKSMRELIILLNTAWFSLKRMEKST